MKTRNNGNAFDLTPAFVWPFLRSIFSDRKPFHSQQIVNLSAIQFDFIFSRDRAYLFPIVFYTPRLQRDYNATITPRDAIQCVYKDLFSFPCLLTVTVLDGIGLRRSRCSGRCFRNDGTASSQSERVG